MPLLSFSIISCLLLHWQTYVRRQIALYVDHGILPSFDFLPHFAEILIASAAVLAEEKSKARKRLLAGLSPQALTVMPADCIKFKDHVSSHIHVRGDTSTLCDSDRSSCSVMTSVSFSTLASVTCGG
jgi:hypothetical protein